MIHNLERAKLLVEQRRFKEAEKELKNSLSVDPNNTETLYLLSICKAEAKEYAEASQLIKIAISLEPANPFLIYLYAKILFDQDKYEDAEKNIREAIRLNPYDADFFGLLSAIYLEKKEWQKGLEYADKGLQISPDNITCLNLRSTALLKLDRKADSYDTISEALYFDPENASTHANLGWGLLEKGNHKEALIHFKKALQINPHSAYAKQGLVEALKARYFIYRIFLRYAFWIGNMKSGAQWGIIIGFYIGSRLIRSVAASNPALEPFLIPIIFLYVLFAVSTWIIQPITNLFLRLNPYGRFALREKEIQTSNFVGVSLLVGLVSFLLYIFIDHDILFMTGIFGITMMIPLSSMIMSESKRSRLILVAYALALAITGIGGMTMMMMNHPATETVGTVYFIGIMLYQWVANAVMIR